MAAAALAAAALAALPVNGRAADAPPGASFTGTAYAKTRHTVRYDGKALGMAGTAAIGTVEQCNGMRELHYHLPPLRPPDTAIAEPDITTHEKFFDTDKALTLVVGHVLLLPDFRRWVGELQAAAASGQPPAVPPDCAAFTLAEVKNGTLWRDGIRYELRFASGKAIGTRAAHLFAKRALATPQQWAAFPVVGESGQTCREVASPAATSPLIHAGKTCVWDRFPFVGYLNWPFALHGQAVLGPGGGLIETIEFVDAWRDKAMPAQTFDVPAGLRVTLLN